VSRRFEDLSEEDASKPIVDEVAADLIAYVRDLTSKVPMSARRSRMTMRRY
jgi:hypothetical protein